MKNFRRNIPRKMRFHYGYYQFADHFIGRDRSFRLHKKSRHNFYSKLHEILKKSGPGEITPIDRRSNLSIEEFKKEYVRTGKPVVLEGAAAEWGSVKHWSFDYFKNLHGQDQVIMVDQLKMGEPALKITLNQIIDGIREGKGHYYRFYPLLERHPEHLKDFDYKWLRKRRNKMTWLEAFQVFIGGDESVTPLHNANQGNLFVQTHGEKKWILYPHYYTPIIDPSPVRNVYREAPSRKKNGAFDPFNPDFETPYNLYKYIDGYSAHLKPGDVLWNPPFYWHTVKNIGESIGVGYRWLAPFHAYKVSFLYSFLDMCAKNPPIWKAYKLYRKDVNLIHLAEYDQLEAYLKSKSSNVE